MPTPTIPVRILNAVRSAPVERVDAHVDPAPPRWCWSCKRHLFDADFGGPGVRCIDCLIVQSRTRSARLALRFLTAPERPLTVRRLVAWRCLASAVTEQAGLAGIDLTDAPLPEPGHHWKETTS